MSTTAPLDHLARLAAPDGLRPLFVAERGSRCFGTEIPTSDHDVIAVVAHPPARYVSIEGVPPAEGTHHDGDVSTTILDLRRALQLATWGNVMIHQVGRSAAVHLDVDGVGDFLRAITAKAIDPLDAANQHRELMNRVKRTMDRREAEPAKAWVQLLQQVLSVRHVLATRTAAPVAYLDLAAASPDRGLAEVAVQALERKRAGLVEGLGDGAPDLVLAEVAAIRALPELGKRMRAPAPPNLVAEADAFLGRILIGVG